MTDAMDGRWRHRIDRRELLRRTGALGVVGLAPAAMGSTTMAHSRQDDATPTPSAPIMLDLLGGDAWAWTKTITGTCPGVPADAEIAILVNGSPTPAARDGDAFRAEVALRPGENEIVAVARLGSDEQRSAPVTYLVRLTPGPTARVIARVEDGRVTLDGTSSTPSENDEAPIIAYRWLNRGERPLLPDAGADASPVARQQGDASVVTVDAPTQDGEYYVRLEITDEAGRADAGEACIVVKDGVARVMDPLVEEAAWIQDAVVYGMVVRNFTSDGFQGVTSRLDELRALGITAIWFAPITGTPEGDSGYAVTDYFNVRPEYGTLEDFRRLVDEAHARGIRVLMDFVPNHTSSEHPYFQHAEAHGEASPYYGFYDRDSGGAPTHYFSWDHLPNLDFDNPEVRRFMTEAFAYWVRDYDVDGFRVDVAWGIKERRPEYWLEWSAELNRIKPDLLLIAEASARDGFYVENGFDAAYDWTDELGVWAWGDVFAKGFPLGKEMPEALTAEGEGYHPDSLILRFLNNNDTGMRFVSVYGVNRYRAALMLLLTLPGIPCIYTGDEVGAQFQPYEHAGEIDWEDPNDLRPLVTRLIQLRHDLPALQSREWRQIAAEPAVEMFAYLRPAPGDTSTGIVLNYSPNELDATITLPDELAGVPLVDLWHDEDIPAAAGHTLTISVPAWGWRVLQPATAGIRHVGA